VWYALSRTLSTFSVEASFAALTSFRFMTWDDCGKNRTLGRLSWLLKQKLRVWGMQKNRYKCFSDVEHFVIVCCFIVNLEISTTEAFVLDFKKELLTTMFFEQKLFGKLKYPCGKTTNVRDEAWRSVSLRRWFSCRLCRIRVALCFFI